MVTSILIATSKTLITSLLTERMILLVTFKLLEWACSKTSNSIDDELVDNMRKKLVADGKIQ